MTLDDGYLHTGFPGGSDCKESTCNAGDLGLIPGFDPWGGKVPWRREWQPTPVFLHVSPKALAIKNID